MATINYCDKTKSKCITRCQLSDVDLSADTGSLSKLISERIGKTNEEFEMVHAGRRLKEGNSLKSFGIKDGSTIFLLKCPPALEEAEATPPLDKVEMEQVVTAFQAALINTTFRQT
ncbi:hypothetical protein CAPTEDRAFT_204799, partial [Capitella teleta]